MFRVYLPQDIPEIGKEILRRNNVFFHIAEYSDEETTARNIADYDAIIVRTAPISEHVIRKAENLKIISKQGVGLDNVNLDACKKRKIWVTIAKGANTVSVAEHAVMLMLALIKKTHQSDQAIRDGKWALRHQLPSYEMNGKTVALFGTGAIGQRVAAICHEGFQMRVIGYDPFPPINLPSYIEMVDFSDELFKRADILSLHCPLTPKTQHLINRKTLGLMKRSALIVNTSRGEVINESDLYNALVHRQISGAGLDVFEAEPPDKTNPLLELKNCVFSPHFAALTKEATERMAICAADAVVSVKHGNQPDFPVVLGQ